MAQWTNQAYLARLKHETKNATNPKAIDRLRKTLRDVELHLIGTSSDPDCDGWIALLRAYELSATAVGRRYE